MENPRLDIIPPEFKDPKVCQKFKAWIETGNTGILRVKNKSEQLKNLIECVKVERQKDPEKVKKDFDFFTSEDTSLSIKIEEASQQAEERAWEILNLIETKRLTKRYLYEMEPINGLTLLKVLCYFCAMHDNRAAEKQIEIDIAKEAKVAFAEKEAAKKAAQKKTKVVKPTKKTVKVTPKTTKAVSKTTKTAQKTTKVASKPKTTTKTAKSVTVKTKKPIKTTTKNTKAVAKPTKVATKSTQKTTKSQTKARTTRKK